MICGSNFRRLFGFLTAVLSVSGQPTSLPNNIIQFKAQHDQYPFRQGYFAGPQYHDLAKLNVVPQPIAQHHDFTQKTLNPIYADELPPHLQPVNFTTIPNHQSSYYPLHFGHQKDFTSTENVPFSKLLGLANVLARNSRPETVKNFDQVASASELHQEVCAPPKPPTLPSPPPTIPCPSQPQSQPIHPCPREIPPCSQQCLPPTPPPCTQSVPKPELPSQPLLPAPKFIPLKNPFQPEHNSPDLSKCSFVSVSPLHSSSKHPEPTCEPPCTSPPALPYPHKKPYEYETIDKTATKQVFPVVPAEKPVVYNPFSENKRERVIPLPNPKAILHHRLHADEHVGYPEGYASNPETQSKLAHVPYVVNYPGQYQTVGGAVGQHLVYPYLPPPRKPIPLIVPPESEVEENCEDDQCEYNPREELYQEEPPSKKYYEKSSSRNVLREIADKLGAVLDEDFRGRRFSSRRYPDAERGYYDDERHEDERYSPGNYARSNRDYYEEDYDNGRRKERKYSRGSY